jgi:hypothetical protein
MPLMIDFVKLKRHVTAAAATTTTTTIIIML